MVSSAPSSPSLGARRGDPGGQLLQELEALSQALYRSSQHGSGPGQLAAPPPPRKEVPSPIRGGGARKESLPPAPRAGGGTVQKQQQQQQQQHQGKPAKGPGPVPHLSLGPGGQSAASRGAHLRHAESEVLKNFDQHIGKTPAAAAAPAAKPAERVLQPWHSQGFEKNLPQVTNFPAWLEDNLNFSKKLEAPLEKKTGWRNWKPFRALAQIGQQKFNCLFTMHVHAVEALPPAMNGMRLAVSCKRKDSGAQTGPVRVFQGNAEFEETLYLKSTIYGSKEGKGHAIRYMSKSFTLSVVALDADELVLGKHRLDLSRLLPDTYDGKVDDSKPASWTTSFQLSGKAKGGNLVASFAVEILDSKEYRNLSNTSGRFMESPTRRAMRSYNSLPNSAQGTPRMRPSDVNHSPAFSEPDLNDYLGIEHLSLDESVEDRSFKLDSRPKGIPRGGSDMKFKTFAQQLEGKLKAFPQTAPPDYVAPATPRKSEALPEPIKEASPGRKPEEGYGSSEDEPEFVVEDRGMELGTLPESVQGRLNVEREPDLSNLSNGPEGGEQEELAQAEHLSSVFLRQQHVPVMHMAEVPVLEVPVLELPPPEADPQKETGPEALEELEEPVGIQDQQPQQREEEDDEDGKEVSSLRLELEKFEKALNNETETSENVEAELRKEEEHDTLEEDVEEPLPVPQSYLLPVGNDVEQLESWQGEEDVYNEKPDFEAIAQDEAEADKAAVVQTQIAYAEFLVDDEDEVSARDLADEVFLDPADEVADLDDEVDLVAGEFLDMLDNDPAPSISGSDSNSPRALLLKQFEQESLLISSMSVLGFGDPDVPEFSLDDDLGESMNLEELIGDMDPLEPQLVAPEDVGWDEVVEDAELAVFMEAAETELKKANQAMRSKSRAKAIEDEETEALMAEWGLNEKSFESSPPKKGSHSYSASFSNPLIMRLPDPPALTANIGSVVATRDGGSLRSMSPAHFQESHATGKLVMQVSRPVVVPAEMGSSTVDILRRMAASGMENMALHAMMTMPLEDISGKSVEQVASEGLAAIEGSSHRNGKSYISTNGYALPPGEKILGLEYGDKSQWGARAVGTRAGSRHIDNPGLGASGRWGRTGEIETYDENVSLEELAPVAMQKIETLAMEGLKIQADMTEEVAPYNVDAISWEHLAAIEGAKPKRGKGIGMLEGVAALPLVEGGRHIEEKQSGDMDGLMSMAISLEEWMRLDAGVYDEPEASENTLAILAAHHAVHKDHTDLVVLNQKSDHEKTRQKHGIGAKANFAAGGCMGDTLTLAMLVQLRDPLRNFEPVGAPMMALVQAERVLIPPKPRIAKRVSLKGNSEEEEEAEKPKEEPQAPVFKITNVTMSGLQTSEDEKKKESKGWGNQKQQQSGSRWLAANGMGKGAKHPALKSKPQAPSKTKVKQGESLWSISSRVHGTGSKWKEVAALNPHIRNPDVIFANDSIRTR